MSEFLHEVKADLQEKAFLINQRQILFNVASC